VLARIPSSVLNFLQNSYEHDFQHYRAGLKKADFPHRDIEIIESLVRIWSTESTSARKLRLFRQEDRILSNQCRFIRAIPLIQSQSDDHILNLKLYDEEFNILFQCNDLVSHISLLADTLLKTVRDFYKISKENKYLNPTKFADDERDTLQSIEKSLVELKAILGISSKS
jgi:hypothetical protein